MPFLDTAAGRLYYADFHGDPGHTRLPLVLIHGAGGSHLDWPGELRRLPDSMVYALDLPGHGKSEGPGKTSVGEYRAAVIAFLDALGLPRAVLAGQSMGGAICQDAALHQPDRVASLVLISTGARLRVDPRILNGLIPHPAETIEMMVPWLYGTDAPAEILRLGKQRLMETAAEVIHGDYLACDRFDVMSRLGDIQAPALVIAAEADRMTPPKFATFLAQNLPSARLMLLPGGAHMISLLKPGEVAQAVHEFLHRLTWG